MRIRNSLKMALFAFLSALACTVANGFIGLIEISIVADILWFLAYICVAIWLCKYLAKVKRIGKNLVAAFFTFAIALYSGVYFNFVDDSIFSIAGELCFYISAISCLICVLILLGRWIFAAPQQETAEENTQATSAVGGWTCECGTVNVGKFCSECGRGKPDEAAKITE